MYLKEQDVFLIKNVDLYVSLPLKNNPHIRAISERLNEYYFFSSFFANNTLPLPLIPQEKILLKTYQRCVAYTGVCYIFFIQKLAPVYYTQMHIIPGKFGWYLFMYFFFNIALSPPPPPLLIPTNKIPLKSV